MIKWIKSRGFTDRLYFFNLIISWLFLIFCVILTIYGDRWGVVDYSIISVALPLVFAELGVHTGFMIWKAKSENMSKMGNKDNIVM